VTKNKFWGEKQWVIQFLLMSNASYIGKKNEKRKNPANEWKKDK
jgi:hypothetical protein